IRAVGRRAAAADRAPVGGGADLTEAGDALRRRGPGALAHLAGLAAAHGGLGRAARVPLGSGTAPGGQAVAARADVGLRTALGGRGLVVDAYVGRLARDRVAAADGRGRGAAGVA